MNTKIGLIAGNGQFPIIFSKTANIKGFDIYALCFINETDPDIENHVKQFEWANVGHIKKLIKFFKDNNISNAVMAGGIKKTRMFTDIKPDTKALKLITRIKSTHDDGLLRAFADLLESEGIKIQPSTFLLPEILAEKGSWTKKKPSKSEKSDIEIGWHIAKEIGRLDIGQCLIIEKGSVLAVEAVDGTDATIRRGGLLGSGNAVVIKVCKPIQDLRFDMPAVGLETIKTMHEAQASILAIESGKAIVFNKKEMIDLANNLNIGIIAV
ncbi:MAG: UDP-2,3-diacylglucosamine diphosphatase LpxI [Desulfobacterales bacterium]|nr:UDP-2,3-diacylglucosamine diphosphatase LpxI [Desulfobacterales bacterium]